MPSTENGATASSDDHATAARTRTLGRRTVLAGVGASLAVGVAPAPAGAVGGAGGVVDPATVWRNAPTDGDVTGVSAGTGVVAARSSAAFVGLDPESGQRRWRREYESSGAELLTHDGRAYLNDDGTLVALAPDGTARWRFDPLPDQQATLDVGFRGDRCYVSVNLPSERRLLALSLEDGAEGWSVEGPDTSLIHLTDDVVVAVTEPFGYDVEARDLVGYDRADGTELWRYELGEIDRYGYSSSQDRVFVRYDGRQVAVDTADGTERWSRPADELSGLLVRFDGETYAFGQGMIRRLDADGMAVWSLETGGIAFPVGRVDDGFVVIGRSGVQVVGTDGNRRWRYEFQGDRETRAARALDGTVFVADGGAIHRVEGGERTWSFDPDDGAPSTLAVGGDRLYAADAETVYAIAPDDGAATTPTATTAPETTALAESTTAAAGTDGGTATDSGSGGLPGFGVASVLAAALLAALRLAVGDDEDGNRDD